MICTKEYKHKHMLALNLNNSYSSPRTGCKLGTHRASMEIHSAMETPFRASKLQRPEKTWVNVHMLWSCV